MYHIGKVRYVNFGPFEDVTVDFNVPGLTVIEGSIGRKGCDSNGAGKSFLFDGPSWALYGRTIRGRYTGNDIIRHEYLRGKNRKVKGGTYVSTELLDDEGTSIVVTRYRKHPKHQSKVYVTVNGTDVSRGTSPATDAAIVDILGLDFSGFTSSVAFGAQARVKSFFAATDTERKALLDSLLNLEIYADAEKIARRRVAQARIELQSIDMDLVRDREKLSASETLLSELVDAAGGEDVDIKLKRMQVKLKLLEASLTRGQEAYTKAVGKYEESLNAYREAERQYDDDLEAYNDSRYAIRQEISDKSRDAERAYGDAVKVERRIQKVQDLEGEPCPVCMQPVGKTHVKAVTENLEAEVEALRKKGKKGELAAARISKKLDALVKPTRPSRSDVDKKDEVRAERKMDVTRTESEIRENERVLAHMTEQHGDLVNQLERTRTQVDTLRVSVQELEESQTEVDKQCAVYAFWADAFGNRGLKSFLIEAELPAINRRATIYSRRLLGAGARVMVSATSTLKSGAMREKLSVEGFVPGLCDTYEGASQGQRRRMDLALIMSFGELVAGRYTKSVANFWADEIFDGMDASGCDAVIELLQEMAAIRPVALVTHDPRIKPMADRVVSVKHNGKKAVLKEV